MCISRVASDLKSIVLTFRFLNTNNNSNYSPVSITSTCAGEVIFKTRS